MCVCTDGVVARLYIYLYTEMIEHQFLETYPLSLKGLRSVLGNQRILQTVKVLAEGLSSLCMCSNLFSRIHEFCEGALQRWLADILPPRDEKAVLCMQSY